MRPTIGITSGMVVNKDYPNTPAVMGQSHTYIRAIVRAGGVPVIMPTIEDTVVLRQLYSICAGIVFAGGNDIDPQFYSEAPSPLLGETDSARDQQELQIWEWVKEDDKPALGICRGMQLMNIGNGGTLYQDIPTELPEAIVHRVDPEHSQPDDYFQIMHKLRIKPESRLAAILGITDRVNTNAFHHQAVKELGKGLLPTAWTEDNVIEGLEMPDKRFIVAVQSHPESLEEEIEPLWRNLFKAFIDAANSPAQ